MTTSAIITSCTPLSSIQMENLKKSLEKIHKTNLSLENKIDKKLLGGFTVRVADWFFDASLLTQLANLKQEIVSK